MKVLGILLGALGTIFLLFVNLYFGIALIITAVILLLLRSSKTASPTGEDFKTCPRCAEKIKREALVCRYCGCEFPAPPEPELTEREKAAARLEELSTAYNGTPESEEKRKIAHEIRQIREHHNLW